MSETNREKEGKVVEEIENEREKSQLASRREEKLKNNANEARR